LKSNAPAALAAHTSGWTIPLDYQDVYALMRELKTGPYSHLQPPTMNELQLHYLHWILAAFIMLVLLSLVVFYVFRTNRQLRSSETTLRREILARKGAHEQLQHYRQSLETQVQERTHDLAQTNLGLEKSRAALGELVSIASSPELAHQQKLSQLLQTARRYYNYPAVMLTTIDDDPHQTRLASGDLQLLPRHERISNEQSIRLLVKHNGLSVDIPDLQTQPLVYQSYRVLGCAAILGLPFVSVDRNMPCSNLRTPSPELIS